MLGHCRDTVRLGPAGIFRGWTLGYLAVGHCSNTLRLGTARIFCGWALRGTLAVGQCNDILLLGDSAIGHCRDTWWLGVAEILGGWALQGYLGTAVTHCRDTHWLGTARIFCGWALQGTLVVGQCFDSLRLGIALMLGRPQVELRQRLGVADATADIFCPCCEGVLDKHSLHASIHLCGWRRAQPAHLLASWAACAGLQPELEKPGLKFPQRPEDARVERRRPADVYLPALAGTPAALDLAVTAPQRQESLAQAGQQSLAAAASYAEAKAAHLQTARACAEQGVRFILLVAEATGAWDKEASKTLLLISRAVAAREEGQPALVHAEMLQKFPVLLRAHRARAILRRRAEAAAAG